MMFLWPPAEATEKVIYLTFDDGPSIRYTPQILDILRKEHVQATFFVLGYRCEESPAIVKKMRKEGQEVGSHGYSHQYTSKQALFNDVVKADKVIAQTIGHRPVYYRPPGGRISKVDAHSVEELGHAIALWNVDSKDWQVTNESVIIRNIEKYAEPGSIVLLHDGVSNSRYTVRALPELIHYYRKQGYVFKKLPLDD